MLKILRKNSHLSEYSRIFGRKPEYPEPRRRKRKMSKEVKRERSKELKRSKLKNPFEPKAGEEIPEFYTPAR
jgi:hypothetical protein